jgi:hypothetical protein
VPTGRGADIILIDGNGVATLVIQSAVKGVVKPLIGGFSLRLGERLLRLLRIIISSSVRSDC